MFYKLACKVTSEHFQVVVCKITLKSAKDFLGLSLLSILEVQKKKKGFTIFKSLWAMVMFNQYNTF